MPNNVYIGSRYVPIFDGNWNDRKSYEPLIIVGYGNNTYTSKRPVPINTPPTSGDDNDPYWALTGNYNGQISQIQSDIIDIYRTMEKKNPKNARIIVIGDSYAAGYDPDGNNDGWGVYMKNMLGISNTDYFQNTTGGAGFSTSRPGGGYGNQLDNLTVTDPDTIDYIIVGGGYNDYYNTEGEISAGVLAFKTVVAAKYPNAKVLVGMIGYTTDISKQGKLRLVRQWYQKYCNEAGFGYISNIQYTLYNLNYFSSDGIHPNASGNIAIARQIVNGLYTGTASVYFKFTTNITPTSGFTLASDVVGVIVHDGIMEIEFVNGAIACNLANVRLNGQYANRIIIGTVNKLPVGESGDGIHVLCTVPVMVGVTVGGVTKFVLSQCDFGIIKNSVDSTKSDIFLLIKALTNDGYDYLTADSIFQIQLPSIKEAVTSDNF